MSSTLPTPERFDVPSSASLESLHSLLFELDNPVGFAINWIIVVLFAIGVADVLASCVRLAGETLALLRARRRLTRQRAEEVELPGEPAAALAALGLDARTVLGRRVARLLTLRRAGLGAAERLEELSVSQLESYGAIARFFARTLTLVGLLGTVYGLSVAVASAQIVIGADFDLQDLRRMAEALANTLQGMETAFATTLAGLLGALLLAVGNRGVDRWRARLAAALEDLVTCSLLPALQAADPQADAAAQVFASSLHQAGKNLTAVSQQVAAAAKSYRRAGQAIKGASEKVEGASTAITAAVVSFTGGVDKLVGQQERFTAVMAETGRTVMAVGENVASQHGELQKSIAQAHRALEERLERSEQSARTLSEQQAAITGLATSFQAACEAYEKRFAAVLGTVEQAFDANLQRLAGEADRCSRQILEASLQEVRKRLDEVFGRHTETWRQLEQGNHNAWRELAESHREVLSGMFGEHRTAFRAVSDLAFDVNQNVGTLLERLADNHHAGPLPMAALAGGPKGFATSERAASGLAPEPAAPVAGSGAGDTKDARSPSSTAENGS